MVFSKSSFSSNQTPINHFEGDDNLLHYEVINTRKAKAAFDRFSFEGGYNQTCHYYQNLHTDIPKLHAKFHQNPWCGFGEKCGQDNDIV